MTALFCKVIKSLNDLPTLVKTGESVKLLLTKNLGTFWPSTRDSGLFVVFWRLFEARAERDAHFLL